MSPLGRQREEQFSTLATSKYLLLSVVRGDNHIDLAGVTTSQYNSLSIFSTNFVRAGVEHPRPDMHGGVRETEAPTRGGRQRKSAAGGMRRMGTSGAAERDYGVQVSGYRAGSRFPTDHSREGA